MFKKIKYRIRRIFPIYINYFIKHFFEFIKGEKPNINLNATEKRVFFLDAPSYGNMGDQAIAYSMEKFINDSFTEYKQYEILEKDFAKYFRWLKKNISNNDILCLTGGGNMGDMYPKYEAIRRIVIKNFPNNYIIIFPQTISYCHDSYGKREFKKSIKIYNSANNLILMAREENSYKLMKQCYNNCKVLLTPDIVLYLNYFNKYKRRKEIGICLRKDQEKSISKELEVQISKKFENLSSVFTTIECNNSINFLNRKEILEKILKNFGEKELIITDRLHGMIFSYITNTPCIALPNSNGKVKNVYNTWIKGKGKVYFVDNNCIEDAEINRIKNYKNNSKIEFDKLKKELSYIFDGNGADKI